MLHRGGAELLYQIQETWDYNLSTHLIDLTKLYHIYIIYKLPQRKEKEVVPNLKQLKLQELSRGFALQILALVFRRNQVWDLEIAKLRHFRWNGASY